MGVAKPVPAASAVEQSGQHASGALLDRLNPLLRLRCPPFHQLQTAVKGFIADNPKFLKGFRELWPKAENAFVNWVSDDGLNAGSAPEGGSALGLDGCDDRPTRS